MDIVAFIIGLFLNTRTVLGIQNTETGEAKYRVLAFEVQDISKLSYISNYDKKLASREIHDQNNCTYGLNGGFYDKSNMPLGLLKANGDEISRIRKSELFNGFFMYDSERFEISNQYNAFFSNALQTGPVLALNGKPFYKSIKSGNMARRSVVFDTLDDRLFFAMIFDSSSRLDGPTLVDTFEVLKSEYAGKNDLQIRNLINLDGGSASAFIGKDEKIYEWSHVGGWFCYKGT